jgi:VanZ family protein
VAKIRDKKRRLLILTIILVLYIFFLFIAAVVQVPSQVESMKGFDKVVHFVEYLLLAIILVKFLEMFNLEGRKLIFISLAIGISFMILSEILQSFVPGRSMSFYDIVADLLGFIIGLSIARHRNLL